MPEKDVEATLPKHQRIRQEMAAQIRSLEPHSLLPTERELAKSQGVSRATIRLALDALREAGLVYRVQGAGTFVAGPTISKTLALSSFSEDMEIRGMVPSSRLLSADETPAGPELAEQLGIETDDLVIRLTRVRLADDEPICLETAHLPSARVPGLLDRDLGGSLYEVMQGIYHLKVVRAEQVVRAMVLDVGDASLLGTPPGAPALRMHRIGLDDRDRPVESTTSIYRADRYDLRLAVRRAE
ncbi:GntR family transcriptional regulator [Microlunatus elymi]|uniref:GntR family transcriptional regulator n=1 Tax=Microlunatus elymi TaxID=2596828 RepID=A0A516PW46_9ACTN|nr:GntR family transcriptional regulator [Microlunatus elymi]QDP95380.1 GntR family transcriptional regulator [Microlunatus elymi]